MSLEKRIKQLRDSSKALGKRCHVQEPSYSHSFGEVDAYNEVLKRLGVVAKEIRDKITEAKKDAERYKQKQDATDSIAEKTNYRELRFIIRGYIRAKREDLGLLVEKKEKP